MVGRIIMEDKKFLYFKTKSKFDEIKSTIKSFQVAYIEETQEIYTHGHFFGVTKELKDSIEGRLKDLESKIGDGVISNLFLKIIDGEGPDAGKKFIVLTDGGDNTFGEKIDTSDFIKDGMLQDAKYNSDNHILTLTFNTDSGKEAIPVDLSGLVDVYTADDIEIELQGSGSNGQSEVATGDSINTAITKLKNAIANCITNITQGTADKYVTLTIAGDTTKTITISTKTMAVASATEAADGLATAYNVQQYVDNTKTTILGLLDWEEYN